MRKTILLLLPFFFLGIIKSNAQLKLLNETFYADNDTILKITYTIGSEFDTILNSLDTFYINKEISTDNNSLAFNIYRRDEKLITYKLNSFSDKITLNSYFYQNDSLYRYMKSVITLKTMIHGLSQVNYAFISNLLKYNNYLPDYCGLNNLPHKDYFSFLAEKQYGYIYRNIRTETDSVFYIKNNDTIFSDYQKYKIEDGIITHAEGFYQNSFQETVMEVIPIYELNSIRQKRKFTYANAINLLSGENIKYKFRNNLLIEKETNQTKSDEKNTIKETYKYKGTNCVYKKKINRKMYKISYIQLYPTLTPESFRVPH